MYEAAAGFLVKFGIGELSENRERPNFVKIWQKYLGSLQEEQVRFYCCRQHKIAKITLLTAICNGATQEERIVAFLWQRFCDDNAECVAFHRRLRDSCVHPSL